MHESWMSPNVRLARSAVEGRGIFAVSTIARDETILVWGGPSYTDRAGALRARAEGKGVMQWDEDVFSHEIEGGMEDAFLLNHSCDPNAWMADAYTITARKEIAPGEEITADYALWETEATDETSWICRCGSPLCRGRNTGNDWMDARLQERYRGHFSPLLEKRIERAERRGPGALREPDATE